MRPILTDLRLSVTAKVAGFTDGLVTLPLARPDRGGRVRANGPAALWRAMRVRVTTGSESGLSSDVVRRTSGHRPPTERRGPAGRPLHYGIPRPLGRVLSRGVRRGDHHLPRAGRPSASHSEEAVIAQLIRGAHASTARAAGRERNNRGHNTAVTSVSGSQSRWEWLTLCHSTWHAPPAVLHGASGNKSAMTFGTRAGPSSPSRANSDSRPVRISPDW
jgi:hypothetical protein